MGNETCGMGLQPVTENIADQSVTENIKGRNVSFKKVSGTKHNNTLERKRTKPCEVSSSLELRDDDCSLIVENHNLMNPSIATASATADNLDEDEVSISMRGGRGLFDNPDAIDKPIDSFRLSGNIAFSARRDRKYAAGSAASKSEDTVITISPKKLDPPTSTENRSIPPYGRKLLGHNSPMYEEESEDWSIDIPGREKIGDEGELIVMGKRRKRKNAMHNWINGWESMNEVPGLLLKEEYKSEDNTLRSDASLVSSKSFWSLKSSITSLKSDNSSRSGGTLASSKNSYYRRSSISRVEEEDSIASDISDLSEPILRTSCIENISGSKSRRRSASFDIISYSDLLSNESLAPPHCYDYQEDYYDPNKMYRSKRNKRSTKARIAKSVLRTAFTSLMPRVSKIRGVL